MNKFSCIIPAYNEEHWISGVLSAVEKHPLIEEVLVVDDGSHDRTKEVVRTEHPNVKLIDYGANKGKAFAVATGFEHAKSDLLLMLDSDLQGLTGQAVTQLVQPVLDGSADVSFSVRSNSLAVYKLMNLDFVTGERAFHRNLIAESLDEMKKLPGYALEVFLNNLIIQKKLRLKTVYLEHLIATRKSAKEGWLKGNIDDMKMIGEILKRVSLKVMLTQSFSLRALRVK